MRAVWSHSEVVFMPLHPSNTKQAMCLQVIRTKNCEKALNLHSMSATYMRRTLQKTRLKLFGGKMFVLNLRNAIARMKNAVSSRTQTYQRKQ